MAMASLPPPYANMPAKHQSFLKSVQSKFSDPRSSDLKIMSDNQSWCVHKTVVCSASPFFDRASKGGFGVKGVPGMVFLSDDPDAVHTMLHYLYTLDYVYPGPQRALHDMRIHSMADKYEIPGLIKVAEKKFVENIKDAWKEEGFGLLVEEVYPSAQDRGGKLIKALLDVIVEHTMELYEPDEEEFGAEFRRLSQTNAKFASDVNSRLVYRIQEGTVCLKCKGCKKTWRQKMGRGECVCPGCGSEGHSFL